MIRGATISDSEPIAKALWNIWHQFKILQIPSPIRRYSSSEALSQEISRDLSRWLVCEGVDLQPAGFFSVSSIGDDKIYKRWRFPQRSIRMEQFACLLTGEVILHQFQLLVAHLPQQSILLCIPSSLRDAHWAALKAGFRQLGDCQLIVGGFVWLYLDREGRHNEILTKLRRAKVIA